MRYILSFLIVMAAFFYSMTNALAQVAAPPVQVMPQSMDSSEPFMPVDVLAEDVEKLTGRANSKSGAAIVSPAAPSSAAAAQQTDFVSQTITVKPPEVVNASSDFLFQDVTQRTVVETNALPMDQRSANVELYRQSLMRKR